MKIECYFVLTKEYPTVMPVPEKCGDNGGMQTTCHIMTSQGSLSLSTSGLQVPGDQQ